MKKVRWSEQYKVHIPEVDAEHRSIYRIAGELQNAVLTGAGPERINSILQEALTHMAGHFAHEERLMTATTYPGTAWHKKQHDTATRRVLELEARIRAGEAGAAEELLDYLAAWLRDHLALTDRMMGAHLRNWERLHSVMAS